MNLARRKKVYPFQGSMASEAVALISSSADLSLADPQDPHQQKPRGSLRCSRENLISSGSGLGAHRSNSAAPGDPNNESLGGSNASSMYKSSTDKLNVADASFKEQLDATDKEQLDANKDDSKEEVEGGVDKNADDKNKAEAESNIKLEAELGK
jgi:hypothetical protein